MKNINATNKNVSAARKPFGGIDAMTLRLLAQAFMLLDHMWATVVPGNMWMTYVGRMAFPIFAFQISEGFFHTSDRKKYARRLLVFGLISEIPFDLMMASTVFFPFHQNVMFTLLLGLLAISAIDWARQERTAKAVALGALGFLGCLLLAFLGMVDYGVKGVLTVVVFYLFRGFRGAWIFQLVSMVMLNIVWFQGLYIEIPLFGSVYEFQTQGFAVLALLFIWLYNGKKGAGNQWLQYGAYWFYPVHILILYLLYHR